MRAMLSHALTPLSHTSLDGLERLQRKAARICLHLPLYTHLEHSYLLHRIKWPTLISRFKVKHILFAHSLRHNYAPPHILSLHTVSNVQPSYNLRRSRTWHFPTPRTDRCLHSPLYKALHYFNCFAKSLLVLPSNPRYPCCCTTLYARVATTPARTLKYTTLYACVATTPARTLKRACLRIPKYVCK